MKNDNRLAANEEQRAARLEPRCSESCQCERAIRRGSPCRSSPGERIGRLTHLTLSIGGFGSPRDSNVPRARHNLKREDRNTKTERPLAGRHLAGALLLVVVVVSFGWLSLEHQQTTTSQRASER